MTFDEETFDELAEAALLSLEERLSAREDLDVSLAMGVLTIKFEDGARYIINSHRAAKQIWMAAEASAWHFDWTGTQWIAAKSGDELVSTVEAVMSKKLGRSFRF